MNTDVVLQDTMFRRFALARCAARVAPAPVACELSPRQIVEELNKHIVGQEKAKKAVAVALRNRWRRNQIPDDDGLKGDITPKNILMIGPTGVGKSEIARRMARLTNAPYVKVEATKYTEVGVKGKDVDSIIEDLYANAKGKARKALEMEKDADAESMALDFVYTYLARQEPTLRGMTMDQFKEKVLPPADAKKPGDATPYLKELDAFKVTLKVTEEAPPTPKEGPGGRGGFFLVFGAGGDSAAAPTRNVTVPVSEAISLSKRENFLKIINDAQVCAKAKALCENDGIVVIDEIDKIVVDSRINFGSGSNDEAVQQDLLPIVEGCSVAMKDGTQIETQGILFICCGAFHMVKPADMIAELQGRLPVRVDLSPMTVAELRRILVEPKFNLLAQQVALLATDDIHIKFSDDGIQALASVSASVNAQAQNTGARRLYTVVERVLDDVSFDVEKYKSPKGAKNEIVIDGAWVKEKTQAMLVNIDLAKYLL